MLNLILLLLVFILIMAIAFQNSLDLWRRAFCNDDGSPSSARVILVFVLLALVSWTDALKTSTTGIPQIPSTWENLVYVLLAYAFGKKVLDTIQTVKGVANGTAGDQAAAQ